MLAIKLVFVVALISWLPRPSLGVEVIQPQPDENTLYDKTLRISVTKPASWRFLTPKEKRASRFSVTYKDKTIDMWIKRYAQSVRIVIAKYPEPYAGVNPSVSIDLYDLGPERLSDSLRVAQLHFSNFRRAIFQKVDFYDPAKWTELDGKKFAYYMARYTLEAEKIPPLASETRNWFYSLPLAALHISATGTREGEDMCREELDAIVASIRYTPR